jgi:hypothetical protein
MEIVKVDLIGNQTRSNKTNWADDFHSDSVAEFGIN